MQLYWFAKKGKTLKHYFDKDRVKNR